MAGLAVVTCWQEGARAEQRVRRMLDRVPHRGTERFVTEMGNAVSLGSVGHAGLHSHHAQLTGKNHVCVADARLDNREDLRPLLPVPGSAIPSDCELLLSGYMAWGTGLAEHLVGDFALVIWDPLQQCLYAARDPFGVRPLFYTLDQTGLVVASEVDQIVGTAPAKHELEGQTILEYLLGEHRQPRNTFFRRVFRLLPGHWLLVSRDGVREERYWRPPALPSQRPARNDYPAEFRRLFCQAVADRLDFDRPMVAQLSGGLDSSSVVCMAAHIAGSRERQPHLVAASAVYPGLDCDETLLIDTVIGSVGLPSYRWDGTAGVALDPMAFCVDHPWGGSSPGHLEGDLRLAKELGAAAVLSGFGGDELLFERGVFRDLAANGRWLELLHQARLAPRYSVQSSAFFLRDALQALVPGYLRRLYRRFRPRAQPAPPCWFGPQLREVFLRQREMDLPVWAEASQTQQFTWRWLTRPTLWWSVELQTLRASRQGVELRFPYLDRRLADFVLAIPYEHRLPGGQMKRLLRAAMAELLPPAILRRRSPTTFDAVLLLHFQKNRHLLNQLFSAANEWLSGAFVDQDGSKKILNQLDMADSTSLPYPTMQLVLDLAQLEGWIRVLSERELISRENSYEHQHRNPVV